MTEKCFYCGDPAIHQFAARKENGKAIKPGHWCCSTRTNQCPAIRAKNSAKNSARDENGLTVRQISCLKKYGVTHAMKREEWKKRGSSNAFANPDFKQTMLERYGVENGAQLPGVGDKISKTIQSRPTEWLQSKTTKQRQTAESNGHWILESEISDLSTYRHRVHYLTEKAYVEFYDLINPNGVIRSRYGNYHIDHIYSVRDAFLNDVPIEIVSHPCNLRMISESDNKRKNGKSEIPLEELYRRFDNWTKGSPVSDTPLASEDQEL